MGQYIFWPINIYVGVCVCTYWLVNIFSWNSKEYVWLQICLKIWTQATNRKMVCVMSCAINMIHLVG